NGQLVLNVATGDTETYTNTGLNFVYSITEKVQGSPAKLRANVNWYLPLQNGERVSGPMAVFSGTLYFSTFAASGTLQVCSGGTARLWGGDFAAPDAPTDVARGGRRILQPPAPSPPQTPPPIYIQPSDSDPTLLGKVIPGVSIMATPACGSLGTAANDSY